MKKISIIVPVYNTENYLDRCLKSIMNQSLKEIEIIVVNDCSPDNSLEIIKENMKIDKRIILINKCENEGLASARNSGLKISSGEYILHIDSDDWIEKDYLKDMYEIALQSNADMVITDFYIDYENVKIFYQIDQYEETGVLLENKKVIENLSIGEKRSFPCIWNKLVKKEVYIKNNIQFPEGISIGEDLATTTFLLYFSKNIVKLKRAYLHYIQNPNSMTKEYKYSALTDIYFVLNKIERFFKDKNYDEFLEKLKYIHFSLWIFKVKPKYNDELYNKILNETLFLLEKNKLEKRKEKIIKYYFILRKIFSPYLSFRILWRLLFFKRKLNKYLIY